MAPLLNILTFIINLHADLPPSTHTYTSMTDSTVITLEIDSKNNVLKHTYIVTCERFQLADDFPKELGKNDFLAMVMMTRLLR